MSLLITQLDSQYTLTLYDVEIHLLLGNLSRHNAAYSWDAYVCPVPMSAVTLVSNPSDRIGISGV